MCIDINHLQEKIESPEIVQYSSLVCEAIDSLCEFVITEEDPCRIRWFYTELINAEEDEDLYGVLDNLCMAFFRYAKGGLNALYVNQENEAWFPKIILTQVLYPNDIGSLQDNFLIYRGCNISEFNSRCYGQSWTTKIDIARSFAYNHYSSQDWFSENDRIILVANYARKNVLYSDQTDYGEFEIVVHSGKLENVGLLGKECESAQNSVSFK